VSTTTNTKIWAIIPAAGVGSRMNADRPKQYLPLLGKTVLEHTVTRLYQHPQIDKVVLAISPNDGYWLQIAPSLPAIQVVAGGKERCDSVLNALSFIIRHCQADDWVLVHDCARPCIRSSDITQLIYTVLETGIGGLLALPVTDTLKFGNNNTVEHTLDRRDMWRALTPQMFKVKMLFHALQRCIEHGVLITDESSAIEAQGGQARLVNGQADNIKITLPQDLILAEMFLKQQAQDSKCV